MNALHDYYVYEVTNSGYKITDHTKAQVSTRNLIVALSKPTVITQSTYTNITVSPININQTYLGISKIFGMSALRQNTTLTHLDYSAI